MSDTPDHDRIEHRANLLPEEQAVGSDDAELQAQIVLEDSDRRTEQPENGAETSKQTATR